VLIGGITIVVIDPAGVPVFCITDPLVSQLRAGWNHRWSC
jgi:hypothetical protein